LLASRSAVSRTAWWFRRKEVEKRDMNCCPPNTSPLEAASRAASLLILAGYRGVTLRQTRRTLEHWTPDLGTRDQWLTERAAERWVPEYRREPPEVTVNGQQVGAVALIDSESSARGVAYRRSAAGV
jgi:hypothetical protein